MKNQYVCFVVGASLNTNVGMFGMVESNPSGIECDYISDCISISRYSLSTYQTVDRLLYTLEKLQDLN